MRYVSGYVVKDKLPPSATFRVTVDYTPRCITRVRRLNANGKVNFFLNAEIL